MILSSREKLLIALMVVVLLGVGLFYGLRGLNKRQADLENNIAARQAYLNEALVLQAELAKAPEPSTQQNETRSLIAYIENLATRIQLKDRIQLNQIAKDSSSGLRGVNVKVDQMTLDEMVELIHALENADLPLIVQQLELGSSFRDKELLRLSMRVLARE